MSRYVVLQVGSVKIGTCQNIKQLPTDPGQISKLILEGLDIDNFAAMKSLPPFSILDYQFDDNGMTGKVKEYKTCYLTENPEAYAFEISKADPFGVFALYNPNNVTEREF